MYTLVYTCIYTGPDKLRGISDHLPVCGSFRRKPISVLPPRLPNWIAKHPSYPVKVKELLVKKFIPADPLDAHTALKGIIRKAAKAVRYDSACVIAKSDEEKTFWTRRALRGCFSNQKLWIQEAVARYPPIGICFSTMFLLKTSTPLTPT